MRVAWGFFPIDERWSLNELVRVVSGHVDSGGDVLIRGGSGPLNRKLQRLNTRLRAAGYETCDDYKEDGKPVLHVDRRQMSPS